MSSPQQAYLALLHAGKIEKDAEQARAMQQLEHIYQELILRQRYRNSHLGRFTRMIKPLPPIGGLYLWGKVGTGKTFMMDLFYQALPTSKKRMHFHAFMQDIHARLRAIQGQANPLALIAREIADQTVVLCFDEFVVTNIADAMILAELLKHLFAGGVCLVTTSNSAPDDLYHNGIQRQRFLPAIGLIKKFTESMHLTTLVDYRLEHLELAGVYFTPLNYESEQHMEEMFKVLAAENAIRSDPITVFGRQITIRQQAGKVIWFDFEHLCGRPRSQQDYLALAEYYQTVLISSIPVLQPAQTPLVTSLIHLIDVFYDNKIRIVVSAAAEPAALYPDGILVDSFQRTCSRIMEMQSSEYFGTV